jgi:hypothetical protein
MTRSELAFLSHAHAVAYTAMAAETPDTVPVGAAEALEAAALAEMPSMAVPCTIFLQRLRFGRHTPPMVVHAGRELRDAVVHAMAFVPVDAERVDIHG